MACVWPRVNSAEPCVRGATLTSMSIVADLVGLAAVGPLLLDRDPLADDRLLELVEGHLGRGALLRVVLGLGVPGVLLEDLLLDELAGVLALELVLHLGGLVERVAVRGLDLLEQRLVDLRLDDLHLRLAGLLGQLALERAQLLDVVVRDVERVEDLRLGDLARARLDHQDRVLGTGHDEVELGVLEQVLLVGVDDEVAVDLADPHRAHGRRERDVGDHQRGARAVHRQDVVRVDVVDRERDRDELRLVAPALGEERAQRTVDHASRQRALLPRATLALEERAGDLPGGVHPLLDIHRQREEVDVAEVPCRRGAEDHCVPCPDDDRAGGLLGHAAGLERDLRTSNLDGDRRYFCHVFLSCPPFRSVGGLSTYDLFDTFATIVASRSSEGTPACGRSRRRTTWAWSRRPRGCPSRSRA